jgi:precorrin-6B C5,15-methyltransferase / cobalt-precorrin-6B C5,C15-methyltransferase
VSTATTTATIAVVGVGPDGVGVRGRELVAGAALVAGGERHLAAHAPAGAATVRLTGDLRPALDAIAAADGPVVVLASGDPGFFGILRALAERLGHERLDVLPGISSIALAFARAGVPWDDALVVSAHGRDPAAAVNAARAHPKVAILTAPDAPASALAGELRGADRRLVVAARLGEPDELVVEGTADQISAGRFADPHVLLVLDEARAVADAKCRVWPPRTPPGWALPEEAFEHRAGMITKTEVRALALARLGPGTGDLVWDVGAHSGSVAIECARLGAAAIAVERDPELCDLVRANAHRHGVGVEVVCGEAPAVLTSLPAPDAVFVGGGGEDLPDILSEAAPRARRSVVVALAAVERVAATGEQLAAAGFAVETTLLQASRLRPLAGIHRLVAQNPVFVVAGVRT